MLADLSHKLSGLHILHASARIHTDLNNGGIFTLELGPFQLAVGCYPFLQIALFIYLAGHLPLAITVAPIVEAAKAVSSC